MMFCTVDFETRAIGDRPLDYPPMPVGVAIRWPDAAGTSEYLAWGHPSGNNCTVEQARLRLWAAWQFPCIFHNAAFDLEVAHRWFGFPLPREWHDTLFLLFLCYPHATTYALKPTAEWLLSEPPTQQDALHDWILANVPGATYRTAGAYISVAPPSLVGPYAIGDVERTWGIFKRLWPHVAGTMRVPYDRERALMPILTDASRRGIRVDRNLLASWDMRLLQSMSESDKTIRAILKDGSLNVDANDDVADAIERAGLLSVDGWARTPSGKRSTSKDGLLRACSDRDLVVWLRYRNVVATLQRTFVRPWLASSAHDGRLHSQWHQTRTDDGGARTGRIASSNHNLANVPNPQDKVSVPIGMPPLPSLRRAMLPEEGHIWISADYKSQELRGLAHYENGPMMAAYNADPDLDLHDYAGKLILSQTGISLDRKATKIVGFAQLYGAGIFKLSQQLGCSEDEASRLRDAYFKALPGVPRVKEEAQRRWESNQAIVTWGGRRVLPQPPGYDKSGAWRSYDYKALNMLIQGSAADQTKEAIVRMDPSLRAMGGFFLSQLYDEINVSVPIESVHDGVDAVRDGMENMPGWDVPFPTDIEIGPSWGDIASAPQLNLNLTHIKEEAA